MIVVPAEVVGRRRYAWPAIVLALALWGIERAPPAEVRTRVSAWLHAGYRGASEWATLRRWARVLPRLAGETLRSAATRLACHEASFGSSGLSSVAAAVEGASDTMSRRSSEGRRAMTTG